MVSLIFYEGWHRGCETGCQQAIDSLTTKMSLAYFKYDSKSALHFDVT